MNKILQTTKINYYRVICIRKKGTAGKFEPKIGIVPLFRIVGEYAFNNNNVNLHVKY